MYILFLLSLSCLALSASLTLPDSDVTAPSTMSYFQMYCSWANVSQISTTSLIHFNDALRVSLKSLFSGVYSGPLSVFLILAFRRVTSYIVLGRRVYYILITWYLRGYCYHDYFISKVWRLILSARTKTSMSGILSGLLILRTRAWEAFLCV